MKKLFAIIVSLLSLGIGGALNAQEAAGDLQKTLDTIVLYGDFKQPGEAQTVKFKFSATPGEKFIIRWYWGKRDTLLVETADEIEASYTFSGDRTQSSKTFDIVFSALDPTGHIRSLDIDSAYTYKNVWFKSCPELTSAKVSRNYLYTMSFYACPALKFLDCSYNSELKGWYIRIPLSALTYLDCSHCDIGDIVEEGYVSLETLDCSHNRRLRQLWLTDCKALVNLRIENNDSLEYCYLPKPSSLQSLYCCNNYKFRSLDLSMCPDLTTVNCSGNSQLGFVLLTNPNLATLNLSNNKLVEVIINNTSLDSIDLSTCPTLQRLCCNNNQQLAYLNVSNCTNLEFVVCDSNNLSSLDVSGCTKLRYLTCKRNRLSYLNVGSISLEYLTCSHNRLSSLDVSNCLSLLDLTCSHNRLSSLDIGNCLSLVDLTCSHNRLSSLDIGNCLSLVALKCNHNELSTINLSQDKDLIELVCDSNRFSLSALAGLLSHCNSNTHHITQFIPVSRQIGQILDLRSEMLFSGEETECTMLDTAGHTVDEMLYADGRQDGKKGLFSFHKAGRYRLQLRLYYGLLSNTGYGRDALVYYDITVVDSIVRPAFSLPSGAVWPGTAVSLSASTPEAKIFYTTDGSEPDENSMVYTTPVLVNEAMTIKAVAIQDTLKSRIATATYTIDTVGRPVFSVPSGAVWPGTAVSLSSPTPDAEIYYTTDGSEPGENSTAYKKSFVIDDTVTIRAIAIYRTVKSQISTASYTIDTVGRPVFSIPSGKVKRNTYVSLNTPTPAANIYYTTDGIEPTFESSYYTTPICITTGMTIKAVAVRNSQASQISVAVYTIDSVSNEQDLIASKIRVYAKDRTIYLSEAVGEVAVFMVDGHCVYRGFDTVIPMKQSGVYVVSVGGRRWKVAVQ